MLRDDIVVKNICFYKGAAFTHGRTPRVLRTLTADGMGDKADAPALASAAAAPSITTAGPLQSGPSPR